MERYYTQAAFSRLCGVSRESIRKQVVRGAILMNDQKKIDLLEPLNCRYFTDKTGLEFEPASASAPAPPSPVPAAASAPAPPSPVPAAASAPAPPSPVPAAASAPASPRGTSGKIDLPVKQAVGDQTKLQAEMKRLEAQTAGYQLKVAKEMGALVDKRLVDKTFRAIYGAVINHILPMGDRLSKKISADFGDPSHEQVTKVKNRIDEENARTIEAIKKACEEAI